MKNMELVKEKNGFDHNHVKVQHYRCDFNHLDEKY